MKHTVLYVPGLGDKKRWLLWLQRQVFRTWRAHGVRVEIVTMKWAEDVPLKPRFQLLLDKIDDLSQSGNTVSLVGVSAGASAVLAAFAERREKIAGVVVVCGKVNGDVPDQIEDLNPCFAEALAMLPGALKRLSKQNRRRIMTLAAARDAIVPPEESVVDGAINKQLPLAGHNTTCAYILTFKSRLITGFLKSRA